MKNLYVFSTLLTFIIFASCRPPQINDNFDYGKVENYQYTNDFFGCSMNIPENWVVQSREQLEKLQDLGKEMIAGDDKKFKKELKVAEIRTANLITVFKFEHGITTEFNPNISIVAENVRFSPNIKTGEDYLHRSRKLLEQSQFKYDSISNTLDKIDFSGVVFSRMFTSVSYMGIPIRQEYFSTVLNGFSFNIVISYSDDKQKEELAGVLGTLRFE